MNVDDPAYRHVLGISGDLPLDNWYDLLGVRRFESNDHALEMGMLTRVTQVRRYQVGAYQEAALRLLNELSQAYVALTDPESRERYNETLRKPTVEVPASLEDAWPVQSELLPARSPPKPREPSPAPPAARSAETCPQCGKPMPAKIRKCYHCGAQRPVATSSAAGATDKDASSPPPGAALPGFDELLREDLSPEQFLKRLDRMRALHRASEEASRHWPAQGHRASKSALSCHCCRRQLVYRGDAFAMQLSDLCNSLDFVSDFARKTTALGKHRFTLPLSKADIERVRELIPGQHSQAVRLFCLTCFERFRNSPKIETGTTTGPLR